jgi:hypothetical protein
MVQARRAAAGASSGSSSPLFGSSRDRGENGLQRVHLEAEPEEFQTAETVGDQFGVPVAAGDLLEVA